MPEKPEFAEIDFEQIEYRNEYRYTKALFAALAMQFGMIPRSINNLAGDGWFWPTLSVLLIASFLFTAASLYVQYRSSLILTGHSLILRRPLLPDVEISFVEIGELEINGSMIKDDQRDQLVALDLTEIRKNWAKERGNSVIIRSTDNKRKITVEQGLESFENFCEDLTERIRLANERYNGYAKGTSLRQPERYLASREIIEHQRAEVLSKMRPLASIDAAKGRDLGDNPKS